MFLLRKILLASHARADGGYSSHSEDVLHELQVQLRYEGIAADCVDNNTYSSLLPQAQPADAWSLRASFAQQPAVHVDAGADVASAGAPGYPTAQAKPQPLSACLRQLLAFYVCAKAAPAHWEVPQLADWAELPEEVCVCVCVCVCACVCVCLCLCVTHSLPPPSSLLPPRTGGLEGARGGHSAEPGDARAGGAAV